MDQKPAIPLKDWQWLTVAVSTGFEKDNFEWDLKLPVELSAKPDFPTF